MGKRNEKNSGLAGITVLMNQSALDPKVNLQKTEEKILGGNVSDKSNESESVKSSKSNMDDIYKLAKDLDIKIDGLGPDNVSHFSKSARPLAEKLNISESSTCSSVKRVS